MRAILVTGGEGKKHSLLPKGRRRKGGKIGIKEDSAR